MEIVFYDGINNTPAMDIALEAWNDIRNSGMSDNTISLHFEQKAFLAMNGDVPIGIIIVERFDYMKMVQIRIGWVTPAHRGTGVYRKLFEAVVEKAREWGAVEVLGVTRPHNNKMRMVARSLGRVEVGVILRYMIVNKEKKE